MAEPSEAEVSGPVSPGIETAVYIDASALGKLYVASGSGTPAARHGLAGSAHTRCPAHCAGVLGESNSRPDLRPTDARGGRASRHERDRHLGAACGSDQS